MSAREDKKPPTQFHSAQECRDEIAKLNRKMDELDATMDRLLAASIYRTRKDVPREEKQ